MIVCSKEMLSYDNIINAIAVCMPLFATLGSLFMYPWLYPINPTVNKYLVQYSMKSLILAHPGFVSLPFIICISLPLANRTIRLSPIMVLFSMFVIDTLEYWRHRLEHKLKLLYTYAHKEHHQQRPMNTLDAFRNAWPDLIFPLLQFSMYAWCVNITFLETMVVTSLGSVSTYADHTLTGDDEYDRTKFHNVHHTLGWNCNFQQPFFHFWDDWCNTRYEESRGKSWIPFIP
jgi:sterol desaturase/sphingolipid hydroxylase (fatty acid hydroxylase superfamily)